METKINVIVTKESDLTPDQQNEILRLEIECFASQVTTEEVEEDFVSPSVARVLAYHRNTLIACAAILMRSVNYCEHTILLGGLSPCTKESFRGQGIGSLVCKTAMEYLRQQRCDIVFLSVDTKLAAHPLYDRLGFKMLSQPFLFANIRGEIKEADGGMIAPLCAPSLFEYVLQGEGQFTLMPERGYW